MCKGPALFPGYFSRGKALVVAAPAMRFGCVVVVVLIALAALFALSSSTSRALESNTEGDHNQEFLKAAKAGDAATVKTILEAGYLLSTETKNKALRTTCLMACTQVLQVLAANKKSLKFSESILDEVLVSAVCTRKAGLVMLLVGSSVEPGLGELNTSLSEVRSGFEFSPHGQSKALIQAARLGLADIFKFLLKGCGWVFIDYVMNEAAIFAFKGKHTATDDLVISNYAEILELLASYGATATPTPTNEALVEASNIGCTAVVEYFIGCGFEFYHKYKCQALYEAVTCGRTQVVETFYNSNWQFDDEVYESSFDSMCRNDHVEIATLFLKKGKFEVKYGLKGAYFFYIAKNNRLAMVKKFCETCIFEDLEKTFALLDAAFEGHIGIVDYLLQKSSLQFAELEKNEALVYADINGKLEVVEYLLKGGAVFHPNAIDALLIHAAWLKDGSMLERIAKSNFELRPSAKLQACIRASMGNFIQHLKFLFKNIELADGMKCVILCELNQEQFNEMLKFLIDENLQFSNEVIKDKILMQAVSNDLRPLQLLLNSSWPFSSGAKNEALRLAKKRELNLAIEYLEQNGATLEVEPTDANLVEAAKYGHFETFMDLMRTGVEFGTEAKNETLVNGVASRSLEIVQKIVRSDWFFSRDAKDRALIKAGSDGDVLLLKELFVTKGKFSTEAQQEAVCQAVKAKQPFVLEYLMGAFKFNQKFREQVFINICSTRCHFNMNFFMRANFNPSQEVKDQALIGASKHRNNTAVMDMIDAGFKFSSKATDQALFEAAILQNPTTLKFLLSSGLEFTEGARERVFLVYCRRGLIANLEHLLLRWSPSSPKVKDDALLTVLKLKKMETFKYLIGNTRSISFSEEAKNQAFIEASFEGHAQILECLMQAGFEPSTVTLNESLVWASRRGHAEVVTHLVNYKNAVFSIEAQSHSLAYAAKNRHVAILECLMRDGMSFEEDAKDKALIYASSKGHTEVVRLLVEETAGFSEYAMDESLYYAVERDDSEAAVLLISSTMKFSVHATNLALLYASRNGNAAVVRSLLEGDRVSILGGYAKGEAFKQATNNGHGTIAKLLEGAVRLQAGANSGASDEYNALIEAASDGHYRTVVYITRYGGVGPGDISEAIEAAMANGHGETAEHLENTLRDFLGHLKV